MNRKMRVVFAMTLIVLLAFGTAINVYAKPPVEKGPKPPVAVVPEEPIVVEPVVEVPEEEVVAEEPVVEEPVIPEEDEEQFEDQIEEEPLLEAEAMGLFMINTTEADYAETPEPETIWGVNDKDLEGIFGICKLIKIDNPKGQGTFSETDHEITVVAELDVESGRVITWTSTEPVRYVWVKGGHGGNLYDYGEEGAEAGAELYTPINPNNGKRYAISHVTFFYCEEDVIPELPKLIIKKFYDANVNGEWDEDEPELFDWKVKIIDEDGEEMDFFTVYEEYVLPGTYTVEEYMLDHWIATTPMSVEVTLQNGDEKKVVFGNVCLGAGGGHTIGFWGNKNGEKLVSADYLGILRGLNLVKGDGTPFNPNSHSQFRSWLREVNAVNMAYMLSVQLAAMKLNVLNDFVDPDHLVWTGEEFMTIGQLMEEADNTLGDDQATRNYMEYLKNALDDANNNMNFVQTTPCPYDFGVGLE